MSYKQMKAYLSGPITGVDGFERIFEVAERAVYQDPRFYDVVNPVEIGKNLKSTIPEPTWEDYMRADIKALCDCDAIVLLDGWEQSRGACIERRLAEDLGLKEYYLTESGVMPSE